MAISTLCLLTVLLLLGCNKLDAATYPLAFQVRGLNSENSITIKDIESDQKVPVPADGDYSFSEEVDGGVKFNLIVESQPTSPIKQTCTIENGKGTMSRKRFKKKRIVVTCVTKIKHVIILGLDGMGGAYLPLEGRDNINDRVPSVPTIDSLRSESAWTYLAQDALPASSSTNWVSMLGGNPPSVHGVLSNSWSRGDSEIPPTLFAVTREKFPSSEIGLLYDWGGLGRLIEDDIADEKSSPGSAAETRDAAIQYMVTKRPKLLFVHIDSCDAAGHSETWGSDTYVNSLEEADGMIADFVNALKDEGMWDYTALIISSDHGGYGYSHGPDTYLDRTIPFIVRTPQGTEREIKKEVRIWDVAATAAALLGIEHPSYWISSAIYESIPYHPKWEEQKVISNTNNYYKKISDSYSLIYNSEGTSLSNELSIIRPIVPEGYASLGDIAFPSIDGSACDLDNQVCSCKSDQSDYRGNVAVTESGKICQKWTAQSPHSHTRTPENYPDAGLDHNYCRNPDGEDSVWCYTTDVAIRWESCQVPSCPPSSITVVGIKKDHPSVSHPIGYEMIWTSSTTSEEKHLTFWNPIPKGGFSCPGVVVTPQIEDEGPPPLDSIVCLLDKFLDTKTSPSFVWDDSGSGADIDGSVWECSTSPSASGIIDPHLFLSRRALFSRGPGSNDCRVLKEKKFKLCKDDQTFRYKGNNNKDCAWVANNNKCTKKWEGERLFNSCPQACEVC